MKEIPKRIYDRVSKGAVDFCVKYGITANQLTLLNHFLTLTLGCYFFSSGQFLYGFVVCLLNGFLDYLDGDVAKASGQTGELGQWLDSGFDVVIQNAVLGAIGLGCIIYGLPVWVVVSMLVSNAASNFVSFHYNSRFGFDSDKGNDMFRELMIISDCNKDKVFLWMIDPTVSQASLVFFTYRYFIAVGSVFNIMPYCFVIMFMIVTVKWVVMYSVYAVYLKDNQSIYVTRVLSTLDEEQNEFYRVRSS